MTSGTTPRAPMNDISDLDFRESLPNASEYLALFESTGWPRICLFLTQPFSVIVYSIATL